jgi:eukaryotic-like serine/threonine-protein kinase
LKKLAEGGMAEVFLARPNSYMGNGRVLVIKRLLPHFSNQAMFLSMFQNEIQVLMGFCHPNTVQLHDFGK